VRLDRDVRVDVEQRLDGACRLGLAEPARGMDDLTLQVRQAHDVVVDDAKRADAGGGEIHERRSAEPAGADDQDAGAFEPSWPGPPTSFSRMWRA
jgi:hypothetical protein